MLPIYHITHLDNLPSIVNGGVCCDNIEIAQGLAAINIAHENIKERRRRRLVLKTARGTSKIMHGGDVRHGRHNNFVAGADAKMKVRQVQRRHAR